MSGQSISDSANPGSLLNSLTVPSAASSSYIRGVNKDDIRVANLSLILRLVHLNDGLLRSELTSLTGLNRSTISSLVTELAALGYVNEEPSTETSSLGRPSNKVTVNSDVASLSFSPDKGFATLAAVGLSGKVLGTVTRELKDQPDPVQMAKIAKSMLLDLTPQLNKDLRIVGLGATVPGPINTDAGTVAYCHQLDWVDVEYRKYLEKEFQLPVSLDNDSRVACLAEKDFGAGIGFRNSVYLYGGFGGIGGGVVIDGSMLRGSAGFASELGHIRVSDTNIEDTAGLRGTLEALVRRSDLTSVLKLKTPTDEELRQRMLTSDSPKLAKLIEKQIDYLGTAIASLTNIFNPDAVVLSGFLSILYDADDYRLLSRIRDGSLSGMREQVVIRKAKLGSSAVLIGAANLVFDSVFNNPLSVDQQNLNQVLRAS